MLNELIEIRWLLIPWAFWFDLLSHSLSSFQAQDSTTFENEAQNHGVDPSDTAPLLDRDVEAAVPEGSHHLSLRNVTGVISRSRMATFERVLWRALRGNLYLNSVEIDEPITDPETDEIVEKNVFVIFAHGNELVAKIKKIAESLGATLYSVDEAPDQRRENLLEVTRKIEDLNIVGISLVYLFFSRDQSSSPVSQFLYIIVLFYKTIH